MCGAVRYRAEGPPTNPTLCHCATCRRAAGAPLVAWVSFPRASFVFTSGQPGEYPSSRHVVRTFCRSCGTTLTYAHAHFADEIDVATCSLDRTEEFPPADHTWVSERMPWLNLNDGLPTYPKHRDRG